MFYHDLLITKSTTSTTKNISWVLENLLILKGGESGDQKSMDLHVTQK